MATKKTILSESEDVENAEIENMLKGMNIGLIVAILGKK